MLTLMCKERICGCSIWKQMNILTNSKNGQGEHISFLENNIKWMFVTENRPIGIDAYGEYTYYVLLPDDCVLEWFNDPFGADDIAKAYVYDGNRCSPTCIELGEDEDGHENISNITN
jgi:hypothetical protein